MGDLQKFIRQFLFDTNWTKCCDISSLSESKIQQIDSSFSHLDVKSKISILFTISNSKQSQNEQIAIAAQNIIEKALKDDNNFVRSIATILSQKSYRNILNLDLNSNNEVFENNMKKLSRSYDKVSNDSNSSFLSNFLQGQKDFNRIEEPGIQFRGKSRAKILRDSYLEKIEEDCAKKRIHVPIPGKGFHKAEVETVQKPVPSLPFPRVNTENRKIPEPLRDLSFSESNRLKTFHSRSHMSTNKPGIKMLEFDDLPAQGPKAKQLKKEQMEKERESRKREKEEKSKAIKAAREAAKMARVCDSAENQRKHMINPRSSDLDKLQMDSLINASIFKASSHTEEENCSDSNAMDIDKEQKMDYREDTQEQRTAMLRQQLIDSAQNADETGAGDIFSDNYQPGSILPSNSKSSDHGFGFNFAKPGDSVLDDSDEEEDDMALLPPTPAFNPAQNESLSQITESNAMKNPSIFSNLIPKPNDNVSSEQNREEQSNFINNQKIFHNSTPTIISNHSQILNATDSKTMQKFQQDGSNAGQMVYFVTNPNQLSQPQQHIQTTNLQGLQAHQNILNVSMNPGASNNQKIFIALKPEQVKNLPTVQPQPVQILQASPSSIQQNQNRLVRIRPNNVSNLPTIAPLNLKSIQPQPNKTCVNTQVLRQNSALLSPTDKSFRGVNPIILSPNKISELGQTAFTLVNPQDSPSQNQFKLLSPKMSTMQKSENSSQDPNMGKAATLSSPSATQSSQIFVINAAPPNNQNQVKSVVQPNIFQFNIPNQVGQQARAFSNVVATSGIKLVQASPQSFPTKIIQSDQPTMIQPGRPPIQLTQQNNFKLDNPLTNTSLITIQDDISLDKSQLAKLETILEDANRVTRPDIATIIAFIAGKSHGQGLNSVEIFLGEFKERVFDRNTGQISEMAAQTFAHLDYSNGSLEKIKRYQKLDQTLLAKLPFKSIPSAAKFPIPPASQSSSSTVPASTTPAATVVSISSTDNG